MHILHSVTFHICENDLVYTDSGLVTQSKHLCLVDYHLTALPTKPLQQFLTAEKPESYIFTD